MHPKSLNLIYYQCTIFCIINKKEDDTLLPIKNII